MRDRASYAFALVSVAAAVDVADGKVRDIRLALGGVAHKPWRAFEAEKVLRGAPATAENFRAAAEAELRPARGLKHNAFKIELAKRVIVHTLERTQRGRAGMSLLQKAIGAVLRLMPDELPDPLIGSGRVVGQPVSRVDGALKVTGKARFAAEVPFENLAFAAVVYSTIARGSIASIDTAEAEAAAGVLLAMTYKNAPRLKAPLMMVADAKGAAGSNLPVMQDAKVRWNGEPVACIVAETQEQADHAAALVRVTYESEPATTSFEAAKAKAKAPDNILGEPSKITVGDAEAALAKAPFRVDRAYTTPRHNHCAIELHAVTVVWEGDGLLVHDATQMLHLTRSTLAAVFGLKEDKVRILSPFVGGGFGNKAVWDHHVLRRPRPA